MEIIEYKNHIIEIVQDTSPESPREWDNLGTMYCLHERYDLGDKHNLDFEEIKQIAESDKYISLPIYMYDHSGITINTTGFSCTWDSGQLGIIAVSKDKIRKEFNKKRLSKKFISKILEYLASEVKTYDQYLNNDVYGFEIKDSSGNVIDSCWGFYGQDCCISEAKSYLN
jgi:hypothetical protein